MRERKTKPLVTVSADNQAVGFALCSQVTTSPVVMNLPEYLTRTEIARLFGMDPRTAISRFGIKPSGVVLSGTRRFTIFDAARLKLQSAKAVQDKSPTDPEN